MSDQLPAAEDVWRYAWGVLQKHFRRVDRATLEDIHADAMEWWVTRGVRRIREPARWRGFVAVSVVRIGWSHMKAANKRWHRETRLSDDRYESVEERHYQQSGISPPSAEEILLDQQRRGWHQEAFAQLSEQEQVFLLVQLVSSDLKAADDLSEAAILVGERLLGREVSHEEVEGVTRWQQVAAWLAAQLLGKPVKETTLQTGASLAKTRFIELLGKHDVGWDEVHHAALSKRQRDRMFRRFKKLTVGERAALGAWIAAQVGLIDPRELRSEAARKGYVAKDAESVARDAWARLVAEEGQGLVDADAVKRKIARCWEEMR